jgi:hypothetical protein
MKLILGSALNTYEEQERLFNIYAKELVQKYGNNKTDNNDDTVVHNRSDDDESLL